MINDILYVALGALAAALIAVASFGLVKLISIPSPFIMQELSKEEEDGYLAYRQGKSLSDNPHTEATVEWLDWELGFQAASAQDEEN